jgi:7-cyano-7-deazaguanine synthase
MARCVVLLSGGLDSATVLAIARSQAFECHALTISYGQRHSVEIEAAKRVAIALGTMEHRFVHVELDQLGGSALTSDMEVPKGDAPSPGIPITYVPARNTIFLSIALGFCEVIGAKDMFIGVNAVDYSGYPDCRPEFIAEFERLANVATKAGVEGTQFKIHAPLMSLTKAQIIARGLELGVDYSLTHSCYDPTGEKACGRCDSCQIRRAGFAELGLTDPNRAMP